MDLNTVTRAVHKGGFVTLRENGLIFPLKMGSELLGVNSLRLSVCSLSGNLRNNVSQDHSKSLENIYFHALTCETFWNSQPSEFLLS